MENVKSNAYSHLTAKERQYISFPARYLLKSNLINGEVLDFGCGFGKDVEQLKERGVKIEGYDPFYFKAFPEKKYDTILCFYVLNVLLPEEQMQVLMNVSLLLKSSGKAYFAVRRDIEHDGYRIHKVHKKPTYQCNVRLPFRSIFRNENCEIYEYQHYTVLHQGNEQISPFFKFNEPREIIVESATAFSFFDKYPVSPGHTLIIPKRKVSDYFELSWKEQMACWMMVNKVKTILQKRFNPDGFNVGININEAGGQTIQHVHIHVIPRYSGDVADPGGGVRGIIAHKKNYP
jgi:diadenosine tetraphosphate (Ap4A) HIT family hydrolase